MRKLAAELGTSVATVSLALRGAGRIGEATRARIVKHAQKRGYEPDAVVAEGLSRVRRGARFRETLGCLWAVEPSRQPVLAEFVAARDRRAAEMGYRVEDLVLPAGRGWKSTLRQLRARGVRGLIVAPPREPYATPRDVRWEEFAWIGIGYGLPEPYIHRVLRDTRLDARRCIRWLDTKGCRRIGFVEDARMARLTGDPVLAAALVHHHRMERGRVRRPYFEADAAAGSETLRDWIKREKIDGLVLGQRTTGNVLQALPPELPRAYLTLRAPDAEEAGCWPNYGIMGAAAVGLMHRLLASGDFGVPEHAQAIAVESRWRDGSQTGPWSAR